jgi:molybdopterin biosynthesis enzyme
VSETIKLSEFANELLALARPLAAFDMPLMDAHGATLALDVIANNKTIMKSGSRIRSTQIGLAASAGLDHLPTRPQPRVVVISAGADLVEPGSPLRDREDEYETNSWLLTTAVKEAGAVGYRVHTIPETAEQLKDVVEDQLVRADLVVICGESHDDSFALIYSVLQQLGQVRELTPLIKGTGKHAFGSIGPDRTPVVVLPGDPIYAYISTELFVRPMIRSMMGLYDIHRPVIKAKLKNDVTGEIGKTSFVRAVLSDEGTGMRSVSALDNQEELVTLSDATGLIVVPDSLAALSSGAEVEVLLLERRFN